MIIIVVTQLFVTIIYVLMYVQPINNVLTNHWDLIVIMEHVEIFNAIHLQNALDLD